jgi:hypothetical protein
MTKLILILTILVSFNAFAGQMVPEQDTKEGVQGSIIHPEVVFLEPKNNAKVPQTFKAKFEVRGMKVLPAGDVVPTTGHHHIIVDGKPIDEGKAVPMDEKHIHYGKGQTEAELTLPAGKHTLTLQFADGQHISYVKKLSHTITVHVQK